MVSEVGASLTATEEERIPHALGVHVARSLVLIAVTAGLEALLRDGSGGVEAAHEVGSAGRGQSTRDVVTLFLVERSALTDALAGLVVPHAVRRGIAEGR